MNKQQLVCSARTSVSALWTISVFALLLAFSSMAAGCSGSGSFDPGELQLALERLGLLTIKSTKTNLERPAIFVGGLTEPDLAASDLATMLIDCRAEAVDSLFHMDTRAQDSQGLEPAGVSIQRLLDAIAQVEAQGLSELTVIAHNTGGLVARQALISALDATAEREPIGSTLAIDLITFFTPFAGIDTARMRAGYPAEFDSSSDFIATQGALPSNVRHFKVNISSPRSDTLLTATQADALFFDAQSYAAVDTDPQLVLNLVQNYRSMAFVAPKRMIEAFDAMGFAANECNEPASNADSLSLDDLAAMFPEVAAAGGRSTTASQKNNAAFDPRNPNHRFFDDRSFAACGLQAPFEFGFVDTSLPTVLVVHGDDANGQDFVNLLQTFSSANYNVFFYTYQEGANLAEAFDGEVEQFVEGHPSLESIVDGYIEAVTKIQSLTGEDCLSVVAHSMGGLIARRAMTKERSNNLGKLPDLSINLTTVASPFGGAGGLSGIGSISEFFLSIGSWFPIGDRYYRELVNEDFLGGELIDNAHQLALKTNEEDQAQDVLTLEGEGNSDMDNDPNNVANDPALKELAVAPIKAGHVEIIRDGIFPIFILDRVAKFKALTESTGTSVTTTPTTSTTTTTTATSTSEPTTTTITVSQPPETTTTTSPATTTTQPPTETSFLCPDGTYNPQNSGCGFGAYNISNQGTSLLVSNFGDNGNTTFTINSQLSASAGGNIVFSAPNHDCTLTCTDTSSGAINLFCSNQSGGTCTQTSTR